MYRYITIRLVQAIITLWFLSLAVFLSVHLTGNPALYLLGPEGTRQDYEQLKKNMGLDKPLPVQYGLFLSKLSEGTLASLTP
jgi:ABC-type dipeptide/oligopeptide/nickel transport system permease component